MVYRNKKYKKPLSNIKYEVLNVKGNKYGRDGSYAKKNQDARQAYHGRIRENRLQLNAAGSSSVLGIKSNSFGYNIN